MTIHKSRFNNCLFYIFLKESINNMTITKMIFNFNMSFFS